VIVINKIKQAQPESIALVMANIAKANPKAVVIKGDSPITVADPDAVRNKRVIVIEDGPTLTHGGMDIGAGWVAAAELNAAIVSPRKHAVGTIKATYEKYQQTDKVLPAMGYSPQQLADLAATIRATVAAENVDVVLSATPIDLAKLIKTPVPMVRATYDLKEIGSPNLDEVLARF